MRWEPILSEGLKDYAKYFLFFIVLAGVAWGGFLALKSTLRTEYPVMVVVSQSMVPTLNVGDFILVGSISDIDDIVAAPQPDGDILVFLRHDDYIVHRTIRKEPYDGGWAFVTKGDNNNMEDGRPVLEDDVIGRVVRNVPVFGYFPLFIKTTRGLGLTLILMAVIFFADSLMPDRRRELPGGSFPWLTLLPFTLSPLVLFSFWFVQSSHLELELLALAMWYVGCVVAPLAFEDDDTGLMFWLYHFVLTVIPLGCDVTWWMKGITPSMWWLGDGGSTVPITWLLQKESPLYITAFNQFALMVLPGCLLFLGITAAKRRGVESLVALNRRLRRSLDLTQV